MCVLLSTNVSIKFSYNEQNNCIKRSELQKGFPKLIQRANVLRLIEDFSIVHVDRHLTNLFQKKSREKAMTRHDTVVRLLIRRYVTAEQQKREEFAITEDDVREIRQDISTFRYDLIDILKKNGMRTPTLDKEDTNS